MPATDHLHPRMFMTARELHGLTSAEVNPAHPAGWNTHEQMWTDKRKDNADGLAADVAKHGVEYPVTLNERGEIDSGHHRIQAAYDANPDSYVPVRHTGVQRSPEEPQPVTPRFPSYP